MSNFICGNKRGRPQDIDQWAVIEYAILLIGSLSEETAEAQNEHYLWQ